MTNGITASIVFALLSSGSMTVVAAPLHAHGDRIVHHRHAQNFASMRAAVPERPTVFPSARPLPYPYSYHETDGLSRNPNDCAVWGCIDSN
jgi:hypothetical protein